MSAAAISIRFADVIHMRTAYKLRQRLKASQRVTLHIDNDVIANDVTISRSMTVTSSSMPLMSNVNTICDVTVNDVIETDVVCCVINFNDVRVETMIVSSRVREYFYRVR